MSYMLAQRRASRKLCNKLSQSTISTSVLQFISKKGTLRFRAPECPQRKAQEHLQQIGGPGQQQQGTQQALNSPLQELKLELQERSEAPNIIGHRTENLRLIQNQAQKTTFNAVSIFKTHPHQQDKEQPQNLTSRGHNSLHQHPQISTALVTKILSMLTVTTQ